MIMGMSGRRKNMAKTFYLYAILHAANLFGVTRKLQND